MSFLSETTIKKLAEVFKIAHPCSVGSSVVRTSCSVKASKRGCERHLSKTLSDSGLHSGELSMVVHFRHHMDSIGPGAAAPRLRCVACEPLFCLMDSGF